MIDSKKDQHGSSTNQNGFDQHSIADWQALAEKSLKGQAIGSLSHITANGIAIDPLYTDRPAGDAQVPPTPLKRWDNRLAVLGNTAAEQNANVLSGLAGGISSLQLTLTNQNQGAEDIADNLQMVLNNVQLDIVPISLMSGNHFASAAKQMASVFANGGVAADEVNVAFNADPIGVLAASGDNQENLQTFLQELSQLAQHAHQHLPNSTAVCINASCYHNAGGSIEHELVAAIATASIYMQTMLDAGMNAQTAHDTLVFQLSCDADVLSNVVKLRVLKSLWHHVASQMGVTKTQCQLVVESSKRMQSLQAPWVNHLRNVSCATAAAMGGAQSIIIHPHNYIDDRFIDTDVELSARVARNIPTIITEESALTFVHDPMGGAYSVEHLSANLSDACWQSLQTLERDGGLIDALVSGRYQADIAKTQQQRIERLQNETDIQVGVNRYVSPSNTTPPIKSATPSSASDGALITKRDAQSFEVSS